MTELEIQQLIEVVRAETQKGGNTKERIATLLTELNDAKMQRDGSNLTPEDITALQTILGSGGITSVETDDTLKGDGSESTPLGLSDDTLTLINDKTTMTAVQTYVTGLDYATNDNLTTNYVNKTTTTTQTMNALLNAPSYILGANIGTPIVWQFGRKDGVVGYADASGVWRALATFGSIYEHNIRGKSLSSTGVTGTYNCDLNAYTRWILTLTGNTTLNFTNMILDDETITIGLTITGNFTIIFPTWLRQSPDSYLYDGTKVNRIVIEITRGGSSPIGWYSITRFDS